LTFTAVFLQDSHWRTLQKRQVYETGSTIPAPQPDIKFVNSSLTIPHVESPSCDST